FVEVGIGDEEDEVGALSGFAGHFAALAAADFVDARCIDENYLGLAEAGEGVAGAVPGDVPDFAGPAAADIDAGDFTTDEGVDEGALARGDLAEHHDFDATADQLVVHLPQAGQLGAK